MPTISWNMLWRDSGVSRGLTLLSQQSDAAKKAADRLAVAQFKAADAEGALKLATTRLVEIRHKGNASATQLAVSEENVAKAGRRVVAAERQVTAATEAATRASAAATLATERQHRASSKSALAFRGLGSASAFAGASAAASAAKFGVVGVGIAAVAALGGTLRKGFGRLTEIENAQAKLTGLGHSAKDVNKIMVNALASVKGTAFGLNEAATVAATAVAAGIKPGQELQRTLKLVADAATIGGTSLSEMGAIFTKVAASNKIQGGTINQLNDRGIPILKLLGDVMHKSQGEVSKLASRGKVDFATFQKAMEQGLGGAALKSGNTTSGAFKNMGAAISRVGAALLKGVFPQIGGGFRTVTKWLDSITPAAERFGKAFGRALSQLGPAFTALGSSLGTLGRTVKVVFVSIWKSIFGTEDIFKTFSDFIVTHQEAITRAIITGGKVFVGLGTILAAQASLGLRAFAFLADSQATMLQQMLGGFGAIAHGAALAFSWIPGIGPKLLASDILFARFAAGAIGGLRGTAAGAKGLADGIDNKLLPGLNKAGQSLDALGKKEIASAHNRDIMAKAEIRHRDALANATTAAKTNGKTLDNNTISGRANRTALNNLVSSSQNYIAKLIATNASSRRVTQATQSARDEFIRVARQMGLSSTQAGKLAIAYFHIPKKATTSVTQPGMSTARNETQGLDHDINNLNGKNVTVGIQVNTSLNALNRAIVKQYGKFAWKAGFAEGGPIQGWSPHPKADNIPIMATAREFMQPVKTVDHYGVAAMEAIRQRRVPKEALQGFAGGGLVSRNIVEAVQMHGRAVNYGRLRDYASSGSLAAASDMTRQTGLQATRDAMNAAIAAAKAAQAAASALPSGGGGVSFGHLPSGGGNRALGRAMAARYGWTGGQWNALNALWTGESGWNNFARNASSGAFGIPQALPPGKMGAAAAGGNAQAQIAWGLGYIRSVYGSPATAYGRWLGRHPHWYGEGTNSARRGLAIVGEHGPEAVWMRGGERVIPLTRQSYARVGGGGGAGVTVNQYIQLPHYLGSTADLKRALVDLSRRGELAVIQR